MIMQRLNDDDFNEDTTPPPDPDSSEKLRKDCHSQRTARNHTGFLYRGVPQILNEQLLRLDAASGSTLGKTFTPAILRTAGANMSRDEKSADMCFG